MSGSGPTATFGAFTPRRDPAVIANIARGCSSPRLLARDCDGRVVAAVLQDERVEDLGVVRPQADAAMRGRAAELPDVRGAVDGVAAMEENRPQARRIGVRGRPT